MTNIRYWLASASIGTMLFAASTAQAQTAAPADAAAESEIVVTGIRGSLREAIEAKRDLSVIADVVRSEEHTSELQSLMRISYAVFCLKKKNNYNAQSNNPP